MTKAVVTRGVIVPREPLPEDWQEGMEVAVEKFPGATTAETIHLTDAWMDQVEALARQGNRADDQRLDAVLEEIRRLRTGLQWHEVCRQ